MYRKNSYDFHDSEQYTDDRAGKCQLQVKQK